MSKLELVSPFWTFRYVGIGGYVSVFCFKVVSALQIIEVSQSDGRS